MHLFQPIDTIIRRAVTTCTQEIDITVSIYIARNKLIKHTALAAGDIVSGPNRGRVTGIFKPSNTTQWVIRAHCAIITRSRPFTVTSGYDINIAVAIDIRDFQTCYGIGFEGTYVMRLSRVV